MFQSCTGSSTSFGTNDADQLFNNDMFNVSAAIDQDDVFNASFSGAHDGFNSDNNVSNQSMDSEFFNEQSPMKQKADESSIF